MALDLDFVRSRFPAFAEPALADQAFFENAGGSYVCGEVIDRLATYYRRLKVQPYYRYPASLEAGEWMDASYAALAPWLGVDADWIHLGPSTSQNLYVLAQALRAGLQPGDEVIVTAQDHEANSGVWRRLADDGVVIREWAVAADSGALELAGLDALLGPRTRVVAFPHCSNIVAQINPVAEICARVRAAGAISVVDGVSYAAHGFPDLAALGADVYVFSLYKTYGPHQGLMALRPELLAQLTNQGHWFNAAQPRKRLLPAGPDHAQIAASRGIAEYFSALAAHHRLEAAPGPAQQLRELLRAAEQPLLATLLAHLSARADLRLLGPADATQRAATVAFVPRRIAPADMVPRLAAHGIMAAAGHFYSLRLLEAMGVDPARGVVRVSFVHYTSAADIRRLIAALDQVLDAAT